VRSALAAALALPVALALSCAPRAAGERGARTLDVAAGGARFRILHGPEDAGAARQVARALAAAAPRAQRFAPLVAPVTFTIHPSHAALERAVSRPDHPWLRAWARRTAVDLQSPRTFGGLLGARDAAVVELLAHELVHCAMYQRIGGETTWMLPEIPRWFSEGLASVAAGQGHRRGTRAELAAALRARLATGGKPGAEPGAEPGARPGEGGASGDPLTPPDALQRDGAERVYAIGHHAVEFLLARHGDAAAVRVLDGLAAGLDFAAALEAATGTGPGAFAAAFLLDLGVGPPARPGR
jgi:hypothetical protein